MELSAEELLKKLQQTMIERTRSVMPGTDSSRHGSEANSVVAARQALRFAEDSYGAAATQHGRALQALLDGSPAWRLIERSPPRKGPGPQVHDLVHCEPVIKIMRESGELAERERMLRERDEALMALYRDPTVNDSDRRLRSQTIYDSYTSNVAHLVDVYRQYYQKLRRAAGAIPPIVGPRVRTRPLLQPPAMNALFNACHAEKSEAFAPLPCGDSRLYEYVYGRQRVQMSARHLPALLQEPVSPAAALRMRTLAVQSLEVLDEMAWDIAAIAVSAFFVRTPGNNVDTAFPLLVDDYFDWRGVDRRKRSQETRRDIDSRVELLCSERLLMHTETDLWLSDPVTGRRKKTPVITDGSFLIRRSGLYRQTAWQSETELGPVYGYMVSLGEWARKFVEERAMLGIFPKQLAEYDLRRQQWERRIGWYLTFQMNNQGSKMTFQDVTKEGRKQVLVTPQHSLKMRTVLANSQVHWEEMARTNPGKVIKQWCDTLETLRHDGLISSYSCLDGQCDGADLPVRSRLNTMLDYRYQFIPGRDVIKHLRLKTARRNRAVAGQTPGGAMPTR